LKKVLFILGPTGVGKSDMAISLAEEFNGEIISADSVQVFKNFDVGSAKIQQEEMRKIPHFGLDLLDANEEFSVFNYIEYTKKKIDEITNRNHLPIIVGGTGLYVKALTEGYDFGGKGKEGSFREELKQEAQEKGLVVLYERLKELSPERASEISQNDEKRIIRSLEVLALGNKPSKNDVDIDAKIFALDMPRDILYDRINKRVDIMIEKGLLQEVENLLEQGAKKDCQPMRAIGYKEGVSFLEGNLSKEEMVELIKKNSRNYAKRQLTFCRGIKNITFIDVFDREKGKEELIEKTKEWL